MSKLSRFRGSASKNLLQPTVVRKLPMQDIQGLYDSFALNLLDIVMYNYTLIWDTATRRSPESFKDEPTASTKVFISFNARSCESSNLVVRRYLRWMISLSALVSCWWDWPPLLKLLISCASDIASKLNISLVCSYPEKYSRFRHCWSINLNAMNAAFLIRNVLFNKYSQKTLKHADTYLKIRSPVTPWAVPRFIITYVALWIYAMTRVSSCSPPLTRPPLNADRTSWFSSIYFNICSTCSAFEWKRLDA